MNRDTNMKLFIKCCDGENGEPLGHVTCGYGTLMEHLKHFGLVDAIQRCENRKATKDVFIHVICRVTISNDFQPFVKAGQLASVALETVALPFRLYHEASREILAGSYLSTFFESEDGEPSRRFSRRSTSNYNSWMNERGFIRLKFSDSLVRDFIPEGILRGTGAGRGPT